MELNSYGYICIHVQETIFCVRHESLQMINLDTLVLDIILLTFLNKKILVKLFLDSLQIMGIAIDKLCA